MTGSCNLASLSLQQRESIQADLLACRIRRQLRGLKGPARQQRGRELLEIAPVALREAVVERIKARAGNADQC